MSLLGSEEVAEIARAFQFDSDAKSLTILRLVAHIRTSGSVPRLPEGLTADRLDETAEAIDFVLGKLSKWGWTDYMEPLRGPRTRLRGWAAELREAENPPSP